MNPGDNTATSALIEKGLNYEYYTYEDLRDELQKVSPQYFAHVIDAKQRSLHMNPQIREYNPYSLFSKFILANGSL